MPDWLWYAIHGFALGSTVACWATTLWSVRRLRANERAGLRRWKAIEEEQARAYERRIRDVQAACPRCGLARSPAVVSAWMDAHVRLAPRPPWGTDPGTEAPG